MSFQQALSGLNAASKNLSVIGNNVANASTVGFKGARAEFADIYASSVVSSMGSNIGIGTQVNAVTQLFTQGPISTTDNPFDVAISGEGFFRMDNNGSIVYSRNGQFQRDSSGYLINANGLKLMGYPANATGQIMMTEPQPLQLKLNSIEARSTQRAQQGAILDSRSEAIDAAVHPFDPEDSETYTHSTSTMVYDSLGNSHLLSTYYVKRAPGEWEVYTSLNGDMGAVQPPSPVTTLVFDGNGKLQPTAASEVTLTVPAATLGTGANDMSFVYDMRSTTQTGQPFSNEAQIQDGYTSGRLTSFSIDQSGRILANYSNQQSRAQGQIVLAQFNNPQGLTPLGSNTYVETLASGQARIGAPGSSDFGLLRSGAVEEANVDLTNELVDMITAQRVYQANAQTIKTQDSILQTLVNLR